MLPFSQHTELQSQYENFTGGGTSIATLTFTTLNPKLTVPVTHTMITGSYILAAGLSMETSVERCEFRSSLIPAAARRSMQKGLPCTLTVAPGAHPVKLQLWDGGLVAGGGVYRFMLVDADFKI